MAVVGILANIASQDFDQPPLSRLADDALGEGALEHPWKDRQDMESHQLMPSVSSCWGPSYASCHARGCDCFVSSGREHHKRDVSGSLHVLPALAENLNEWCGWER